MDQLTKGMHYTNLSNTITIIVSFNFCLTGQFFSEFTVVSRKSSDVESLGAGH